MWRYIHLLRSNNLLLRTSKLLRSNRYATLVTMHKFVASSNKSSWCNELLIVDEVSGEVVRNSCGVAVISY